ncbi:hypothetical protein GOODEAATRI_000988 [Goodea atripinnis]|uniref:Uncharacterized protein n=1 Tax=Goodea atripinnis TaxID=208336 RepID=A0ABV0PAE8_9TELE
MGQLQCSQISSKFSIHSLSESELQAHPIFSAISNCKLVFSENTVMVYAIFCSGNDYDSFLKLARLPCLEICGNRVSGLIAADVCRRAPPSEGVPAPHLSLLPNVVGNRILLRNQTKMLSTRKKFSSPPTARSAMQVQASFMLPVLTRTYHAGLS